MHLKKIDLLILIEIRDAVELKEFSKKHLNIFSYSLCLMFIDFNLLTNLWGCIWKRMS